MASIISSICSQLPQNDNAKRAAEIGVKIEALTNASRDTSSAVFKSKITDKKAELVKEKEECIASIRHLNGEFFQDPNSILKQDWDTVVKDVKDALNENLETRYQLDGISVQLKSQSQMGAVLKASSSIATYKYDEEQRDKAELRLNEILSLEKADPEVPLSLDALEKRQKELCGEYYQDPKGLLDQVWKNYQASLTDRNGSAANHLQTYNHLETERKNNEILIKRLNSVVPALPGCTIEALAKESIQGQIDQLKKDKESELALAGVDWKKTAILAGVTFLYGLANITDQ